MAIAHATPGQVIDLFADPTELPAPTSFALFKSDDLELIRLVLPRGKALPPHRVSGEITLQCLSGVIDFSLEGRSQTLRAGQMLHVGGGMTHGVTGIEDASALLTIVLRRA